MVTVSGLLLSLLPLGSIVAPGPGTDRIARISPTLIAQVPTAAGDGTGTIVTPQGQQFDIQGGSQAGQNQFHSFSSFNLSSSQTANFLTSPGTQNVFSRILGGASQIDGRLQLTGSSADLFLLNPAGILFGPNASLNLPGAFTASTAQGVRFAGGWFQVFGGHDYNSLTGQPLGFGFGTSAPILNLGQLRVGAGQDLTFLGGTVLNLGQLSAGGQLTLATAAAQTEIALDNGLLRVSPLAMPFTTAGAPASPSQLLGSVSPTLLQATGVQIHADGSVHLTADPSVPRIQTGDVVSRALNGGQVSLTALRNLILEGGSIQSSGAITLQAQGSVIGRSSLAPLTIQSGGDLLIRGNAGIDWLALGNGSGITAGGNLRLVSDGVISADTHLTSGGHVSLGTTAGLPADFRSLYDPIIRALGDVSFGDYTGAALKVEATGSIFGGNITITGPDTLGIPVNDPDFGILTTTPALILRAGVPVSSTLTTPGFSVGGTTSPAQIQVGDLTTRVFSGFGDAIAGPVILQAPGSITTGNIDASAVSFSTAGDRAQSGSIQISAGTNVQTGRLDTGATSFAGAQSGSIQVTAGGNLQTGAVTTFADSRGGVAQAASITLQAGGNLGFGFMDGLAIGDVGSQGGAVTIRAGGTVQGDLAIDGRFDANTTIFSGARDTDGGAIAPGSIQIQHNGGPDNIPFTVGSARPNGVIGNLSAVTTVISGPTSFGQPGTVSQGPNNDIQITFVNDAPRLSNPTPLRGNLSNSPLSFTLGSLGVTVSDPDGDNTSVQIAAIAPGGQLRRNGIVLGVGATVGLNDPLQFIPASNNPLVQSPNAFTLQASDRLVDSAPVPVPLHPPQINSSESQRTGLPTTASLRLPPNLAPDPAAKILQGTPMPLSPISMDLALLGMMQPEPLYLMGPPLFWATNLVASPLGLNAPGGIKPGGNPQPGGGPQAGGGVNSASFSLTNSLGFGVDASSVIASEFALLGGPWSIPPGGPKIPTSGSAPAGWGPNGFGGLSLPGVNATPYLLQFPPGTSPDLANPSALGEPGAVSPVSLPESGPDLPIAPGSGSASASLPGSAPGSLLSGTRGGSFGEAPGDAVAQSAGLPNCMAPAQALKTTAPKQRVKASYQALIECSQQTLAIATQRGARDWQVQALNNLAIAYFAQGNFLQALQTHQQQLIAAQGNVTLEGIALTGIGAAHASLGDYATAITHYTDALKKIDLRQAAPWRSLTLRNLGNAHLAQQHYDTAKRYQSEALNLSRQIQDRYGEMQALGNLGNLQAMTGEFGPAVMNLEQSLTLAQQLGDRIETAQSLLGLGTAYTYQRSYTQALPYHRQSLDLARELGNPLGEGIALTNLGDVLFRLGQVPESEQVLRQAIATWESLRAGLGTNDSFKVSVFETQIDAYRNLQEVLVSQAKTDEALVLSERSRARAFVELLARGLPQSSPTNPQPLRTEPLRTEPLTLDAIRQVARTQQATLVQYSIIREQAADTPHGTAAQTIGKPPESFLYIWVIQPDGRISFRKTGLQHLPPESLTGLVAESRCFGPAVLCRRLARTRGEAIAFNEKAATTEKQPASHLSEQLPVSPSGANVGLQQLYALLIGPIVDLLPRDPNQPVIFLPQEQLFLVPFPALQTPTGQHLVEQHTSLTAPSIQVLDLTAQRAGRSNRPDAPPDAPPVAGTSLIVGNPSPMPRGLAPLPFAEVEANQVAQVLQTQALTGAQATEVTVRQRLPQSNLVHFATHGLLDELKPLEGAIALTPGTRQQPDEDGLLTAAEVLQLKLKASLVVLSACDTGRGRITGDGVLGLSRSFLAAGAERVLVSLWAVPDDSTSALMTEFHRLRPSLGPARALRQAMLMVKADLPNPGDWAAFTVIGPAR